MRILVVHIQDPEIYNALLNTGPHQIREKGTDGIHLTRQRQDLIAVN